MKTIGTVESMTGGLLAAKITKKPGASKYFKGSIVSYSNDIKEKFGIDTSNGVINKETALKMAEVGKEILNVDICVAITGNAGPTIMDKKDIGVVYIAINNKYFEKKFKGNRQKIRKQTVEFILKKLFL